ncbi:hypothetical protein LEM8419_01202 [Neolewinella maritima]|uniref:Lipoprotein n=1 Tax=Neolewinella maritima TaxID=1383882 RepID=A0ABN8F446_9BACT|nr:hypothetical protein [Neolewinella maritima]CAH0999986.1 hypothetical protein LEM8419_01202 [Neolewinella maritima]
MILTRTLPYLLACVLLIGGLLGCDDEDFVPSSMDELETYYPLELNRPAFYTVDSIVLRGVVGGTRYDSSRSEARETLVESFVAADGQTVYRGERWVRRNDTQAFRFERTFTVSRTPRTVERSEDNLTFTKLTLPLREGSSWDGNAAFDERRSVSVGGEFLDVYFGWDYRYSALGDTATLASGLQVDSVLTVTQAEVLDNQIDLRRAYERYAAGLGLIERFVDARHTQCRVCCNQNTATCVDLSWDEKAEKGYIIHEKLVRRE